MMAETAPKFETKLAKNIVSSSETDKGSPLLDPHRISVFVAGLTAFILSYLAIINISDLTINSKLILASVSYAGLLFASYNFLQMFMSLLGHEMPTGSKSKDFSQRFLTLFLSFIGSQFVMYSLIYVPVMLYSFPSSYFLLFSTSILYSAMAAGILTRMDTKAAKSSSILKNKLMARFFDDERSEKIILFVIAALFGPGIISMLLQNVYWPVSLKIQLATVAYLAVLYLFFNTYDNLVSLVVRAFIGRKPDPSIPIEFIKFYLTFLSSAACMYTFVYVPVLHYNPPRNFSLLFGTSALYSFLAAAIFYRFRQMKQIALKSKVAQAEAQYSLLESQMQPHFLFNSLNVLSELIYVDPDLANSMAQKMADLYREILNNSKYNFSNLESEISILKKYVEIQKIRFGERIKFTVDVSPAFYNLQIPSLMLQTLVENAIKHGISPKQEGGEITLSVRKEQNLFEVCISNTGQLYKGHKESKRSTGLQNTKNRLALTYGSKSSFRIYSDETRTYVKFLITGRTS